MPQVTILEGGKPKSFAGVDKLQIALSGGGTSLWVPKDTRLLTVLTASVNGVYPPPEGYYGFDTAIVDVEPSNTVGINGNDEYVIIGSEPTTPNPPDDPPVWPTTPDDPYDPDNPDGYGWDPWEDTDPWDKDPYKDDWDEGEKEMTETHIPSGIKIIVPPNKASYTEGEPMDYSGISVQLVDENGGLFTNDKYPNGLVPFSELVFPVKKASMGYDYKGGIEEKDGYYYVNIFTVYSYMGGYVSDAKYIATSGTYYTYDTYRTEHSLFPNTMRLRFSSYEYGRIAKASQYCDKIIFILAGGELNVTAIVSGEYGIKLKDFSETYSIPYGTLYRYDGHVQSEAQLTMFIHRQFGSSSISNPVVINDSDGLVWEVPDAQGEQGITKDYIESGDTVGPAYNQPWYCFAASYLSGGQILDNTGKAVGNKVPVQWVSPYDNKTYEDGFPITVTKSSSADSDPEGGGGGFSGGGGEGTGGEGGGGGF